MANGWVDTIYQAYQGAQKEIDDLSQNDKLAAISKIKDEGLSVKEEPKTKVKDKEQRIADWENLKKSSKDEVEHIIRDIKAKELKMTETNDLICSVKKNIEALMKKIMTIN